MTTCHYCDLAERGEFIYKDEDVVAVVKENAVTPGEMVVFSRQHCTILEMVSDVILQKCAVLANKVSIAVFETLGAQGTNIVIANGLGAGQKIPHFGIEIIPRREKDGLNLQWQPKQLLEEEMDTAFLSLKQEAEKMIPGKQPEKKKDVEKKSAEEIKAPKEGEKNYLLKSLRRIP
ncbi:HIT family protein [Candidatus Woesearchaeota archaeon]|nr:HIT family protein [Candidatus Woesearchaeota archaeon]